LDEHVNRGFADKNRSCVKVGTKLSPAADSSIRSNLL
ncbi:hypothetical protein scyTo_0016132, partial [Scyliorhinus torazame]|nr:hypothetical protein [Scyliorhinus torazame]